jgi:hypothetical protein
LLILMKNGNKSFILPKITAQNWKECYTQKTDSADKYKAIK